MFSTRQVLLLRKAQDELKYITAVGGKQILPTLADWRSYSVGGGAFNPTPADPRPHPSQSAGVVEDALVDQVTVKALNPLSFVVIAPPPVNRQTIPTGSSLLPGVLNVARRVMSFKTAPTRVQYRDLISLVSDTRE